MTPTSDGEDTLHFHRMTSAALISDLRRPKPLRLDGTSLFLDIDGTLAAFEATPDAVFPTPRRTALLQRLGLRLGGRLAAISGRDLASIDRILAASVRAAAGVHGLERRRPDGEVLKASAHPALASARMQAETFAATRPGVLVEDKGLAFALHYRQAPDMAGAALALAARLAEEGLAVQPGDGVVELKTPGADKGVSVRAFMGEAPFSTGAPVFVGDDLTDEDAFAAVEALGGFGVLVGEPRPTLARYRLTGVEDVLAWLEHSLET
ncbi:MAG: trehalose-phosphatase [Caulobacteraceae bacterium]